MFGTTMCGYSKYQDGLMRTLGGLKPYRKAVSCEPPFCLQSKLQSTLQLNLQLQLTLY